MYLIAVKSKNSIVKSEISQFIQIIGQLYKFENMQKKHKVYLIFSIVYWLLVLAALLLFGFAFQKVHINKYGILRNYYNSWIDERPYISGLYHVGIGCYFIQFPSSKVYLNDLKVNVTNYDMNSLQVSYSLVYRIVKDQLYNLYQALSTSYEGRIISTVNSIVSNYFINKNQQQSRVTLQAGLVNQIISKFGEKIPTLKKAIQIQAFWLNQIDFMGLQAGYETAFMDTGAYSEAYQAMQVQKLQTDMKLMIMQNLLSSLRDRITLSADSSQRNSSLAAQSSAEYEKAQRQVLLSKQFQSGQLYEYYKPPKVVLS